MLTFAINENSAGLRADRFLLKATSAPSALIYKAFRKKDIKVNSHWVREDYRLCKGDVLCAYINDELIRRRSFESSPLKAAIVYEDKSIIIFNKPAPLPCQPDKSHPSGTLSEMLKSYLADKGEYIPETESSFSPALCNRIDTNTTGLVIGAKNAAALREMNEHIRSHRVHKYYICALEGTPEKKQATVNAHITKDEQANISRIGDAGREISMEYKIIESQQGFSVAEVELHTGRSHQIRAYFSSIGCPLRGDKKYGASSGEGQALIAYKLFFDFEPCGALANLGGRTIQIEDAVKSVLR